MVFLVVEQQEPHAGRMAFTDIAQPASFEERRALALRIRNELEVPLPILIDGMDNASRALFSDLPSPAFVIDREGRIADKLPWADPEPLGKSIAAALQAQQVPAEVAAEWPLARRSAVARQLLAGGDAKQALAWLAVDGEGKAAGEPPPVADVALAQITRAQAMRALAGDAPAVRADALVAARAAAQAAWSKDPAHLVAALTELAETADDDTRARPLWQAAAAALEPRAPLSTRAFLERSTMAK